MAKILSKLRERGITQMVAWALLIACILLFLAGFLIREDRVWTNPVNEIEDLQR